MTTVLAAVAGSPTDAVVLATAKTFGELLGARVEAIHVRTRGVLPPQTDIPLRLVGGDAVEELARAGEDDDVVALVLGARGRRDDPRPLGATAEAVATRVARPVLVVPPEAGRPRALRRILVPLEGTQASSLAPRVFLELAPEVRFDVVALHVLDAEDLPSFSDQPQHELRAWGTEFLARNCPTGIGAVHLETRLGSAETLVPLVAEESHCDLVALAWGQQLAGGRAPVVRAALQRSHRPVLLVPARTEDGPGAGLALAGADRPQT